MKANNSVFTKITSMFLSILLVFYLLPISAVAEGISQTSDISSTNNTLLEETENSWSDETQAPYTYYNDVYEVEELRGESVKHFRLADGSYVAAQYGTPIHYLDESGAWQNIDNTLTESGSEFVTNDARVKFIKKTTGNGSIFTLHDGNTKITLSLVGANKKVSGVVTNAEETETTEIGKLMSLEGLSSTVRYNEILDGVDIEYVLDSLNIKENIIIKDKNAPHTYTFTLALNGLEAELLENGDISITKNGEEKYVIPAPIVFDSAEVTAPADAAEYTLTDNGNGKYTLSASVSSEWMNSPDRVYPVTLDPAIMTGSEILDTYGTIGTPSSNGSAATLTVSENQIALVCVISLPTLPIGAHVADAKLVLTRTSGSGSHIGAYIIESSWGVTSYDVGNVVLGELVDHCSTRSNDDGSYGINGSGQFSFNITKAVRAWYNDTYNHGIALKPVDYHSPTTFASANHSTVSIRPAFMITYVNTFGVEDYYSYSTQSGGAAGTGYVNYATGDLTFSIGTLTSTDYLMPVTPTLVYNSALANKSYTSANVNTPETDAYIADGFKLNFAETLLRRGFYPNGELEYYYIWADADGTEHYFYPTDTANVYRDDSGLLLTLNTSTSTNPTITDLDNNVRRFAAISGSSVAFRLSTITDKSGNSVTLIYNSNNQVTAINLKPKSGSTTTTLSLHYNAGYLCRILNVNSQKAVILRYSDTYNGEISTTATKYLRQVIYAHGTDDSPSWSSYYTSGSASDVVTDATMYYEYDENGYLLSAKNGLADYTVNYEWTNGKVSSVYEKGGSSTGTQIGFTYGEGYTEVMTPGGDALYSTTADNIINHYSYDSCYRVTNAYSMSYNRGTIYGASSGVYSDGGSEVGNGTKNKLTETVNISGASTNYILNGDFLDYSDTYSPLYWTTSHSTITVGRASVDEAVTISLTTSDTYYIYQYVYLPYAGEYTISFDVQSSNTKDIIMEVTPSVQGTRVNLDEIDEAVKWYTVSKTFNATQPVVAKIQISASRRSGATFTSTPYVHISKVRLEKGAGGGAYNYVDMGDFIDTYRTSQTDNPTNVSIYTAWDKKTSSVTTASNLTSPFRTAIKISGALDKDKYIKQTFYTAPEDYIDFFATSNPMYNSARTYIVSGFAKGNEEVVANHKSKFALRADVYYYQGANKGDVVISHYFHFNPDCTDWQFVSGSLNTYRENELDDPDNPIFYDVVRKIDIVCEYSYQTDSSKAYFDRIAVIDAHNDRKLYEYENGQISVIKGLFENEYREYDSEGRLVRVSDDSGNLVIYEYDTASRVKSETTYGINQATPKMHTVYTYNTYGLLTKTETYPALMSGTSIVKKPGSASVITTNTYETTSGSAIFGALLTTSDGAGTTLRYFYDNLNGYLLAEINLTDGVGTAYTYDALGNLTKAESVEYNSTFDLYYAPSGASNVSYEYNAKNQLSKIITASEEYNFTYDSFGNLYRFIEGNIYYYYDRAGKLTSVKYVYSDEYYFEYNYTYDDLGRLVEESYWYSICYEFEMDGDIYSDWDDYYGVLKEYEYTSDGKLYRVYDALNDEYTQYSYDVNGRLESILTYDSSYANEFVIQYYYSVLSGEMDKVSSKYSSFAYTAGTTRKDKRIGNYYSYDDYERLNYEEISTDNVRTELDYTYDDYSRLSKKTTENGSYKQEETYGYKTASGVTTGEIVTYTSKVGSTTKTYTYTYDGRGNIKTVRLNGTLLYEYLYDDLGQLVAYDDHTAGVSHYYGYDEAGNIDAYDTYDLTGENAFDSDEYEYTDGKLTSFNGGTISYDSSGRTVSYRGKAITYFTEEANAIKSIGNAVFTYNADGLRRSKTVNGVTHYYYYDGINLVKEEWGDNILVFFYDVNGSPVGMQYRNSTYASGMWDTYLYEKNLQGDIVAVYNTSGTKLVSYTYDPWGRILGTTYHNGGANKSVVHNPFRYRGYYYDDDLDLYYLATRYYDPEVRRFVTADDPSYLGANGDLVSYNLFAYCSNNPVMYVDPTGHVITAAIIGFALIGASLAFAATAYYDYADDGEVFNGSIDAGSYVANTLVGGAIGGGAAYLAPEIGAFLTSSFSYTMPSLAAGGEAVAVTISGAQIAAGVTVAGVIINAVTTGKSNGYWGQKYSNDHAPEHVHLKGRDTNIRIGRDGNPLKGEPSLNSQQRKALKKLWREIAKLFENP